MHGLKNDIKALSGELSYTLTGVVELPVSWQAGALTAENRKRPDFFSTLHTFPKPPKKENKIKGPRSKDVHPKLSTE